MVMKSTFYPQAQLFACMPRQYDEDEIRDEPMLFSASGDFALENGGPLTRDFVERIWHDWDLSDGFVIDTRVHMLMDGWLPCIPGWHVDGLRRPPGGGQPEWVNREPDDVHLLTIVGATAMTQFLVEPFEMVEPRRR